MKTAFLLRTLLLACVLCTSNLAFAWGAIGHRVIGEIAKHHLTPVASAAIDEILQSEDIALATTWADEMRSNNDNPVFWGSRYTNNWHYLNVGKDLDYQSSTKSKRGDAYTALQTFTAILREETVPAGVVKDGLEFYFGDLERNQQAVKLFALKFTLHILGDLQQPLHSGLAADNGGNAIKVLWFGKPTNLHTVWDSRLVDQQDIGSSELASKLESRINNMSKREIQVLASTEPLSWIDEAQILLKSVYDVEKYHSDFSNDYVLEFVPITETQLIKGGLRTAYYLNAVFAK